MHAPFLKTEDRTKHSANTQPRPRKSHASETNASILPAGESSEPNRVEKMFAWTQPRSGMIPPSVPWFRPRKEGKGMTSNGGR